MYPPVDYPVNDDAGMAAQTGGSEGEPITYAALLDRYAAEQPITEDMIQSACLNMEAAQQLPFAARPSPVTGTGPERVRSDALLARLLKSIR